MDVDITEIGSTNTAWDPDDEEFVWEVVRWGVAAFTIATAVLLSFLIYFAVRCVCWTCLNDECCDKRNKVKASQSMVRNNNIVAIILLVISLGAGIWLTYAATPISESLDHLTDTLVEQAETLSNKANSVINTVQSSVPEDADIDLSTLNDAEVELDEAERKLNDAKDAVRESVDGFHGVVILTGVAAIICAVLGLLCVITRHIVFLYLYMIIGFFAVFACWAIAGMGIVGNVAFEETCDMMRLHAAGEKNPYVVEQLQCQELAESRPELDSALIAGNDLVTDFNQELVDANAQLAAANVEGLPLICEPFIYDNDTDQFVANNQNFYVPPSAAAAPPTRRRRLAEAANAPAPGPAQAAEPCVELTVEAVEAAYGPRVCEGVPADIADNPNIEYFTCLSAEPSRPIPSATYEEALAEAEANAPKIANLTSVLDDIYDIVDCGFVDTAFEVIVRDECDPLDSDSQMLASAAFIAAITLTITSFYFCICIQNIRKQDAPLDNPEDVAEDGVKPQA